MYRMQTTQTISIHALCEEGDRWTVGTTETTTRFLSTPSARRATIEAYLDKDMTKISIHALCEEGDRYAIEDVLLLVFISIHALCEEGDAIRSRTLGKGERFLSTPSARRATSEEEQKQADEKISIHALCEEGDTRIPASTHT